MPQLNLLFEIFTYACKLLTVFFFLKLLPVPVNLNVFLVTSDNLILDFIGTFFAIFVFDITTIVLSNVCVFLNLCYDLRRFGTPLFQVVCKYFSLADYLLLEWSILMSPSAGILVRSFAELALIGIFSSFNNCLNY